MIERPRRATRILAYLILLGVLYFFIWMIAPLITDWKAVGKCAGTIFGACAFVWALEVLADE